MKGRQALDSWNDSGHYTARTNAQSYQSQGLPAKAGASGGSSCGAGDKPKTPDPKPSACGSSCGAGDKPKAPEPKPGAGGSSCGAGDAPKK